GDDTVEASAELTLAHCPVAVGVEGVADGGAGQARAVGVSSRLGEGAAQLGRAQLAVLVRVRALEGVAHRAADRRGLLGAAVEGTAELLPHGIHPPQLAGR